MAVVSTTWASPSPTNGPEVYVGGQTGSRDLAVTPDAFQPNHGGGSYDAFVARFGPGITYLNYLSYIGGSDNEYLRGLSVAQLNSQPNVYVVGSTDSYDFYTTPGVVQPYRSGYAYSDGFVARVNMGEVGHVIHGRVTNDHGNGLADVDVSLSGSLYKTVRTRDDGTYSIGGIPEGSSLTLTARRDVFVFEPSEVALDNITASQEVNFSGAAPLIIKGRVTDQYGNGRPASLQLSGTVSLSGQSDQNGYYRFAQLPAGGTYTVTPLGDPIISYSPPSQTVTAMNADQVFNFTQLSPPRITGRVTESNGVGRYCTVTLRNAEGAIIQERTTDYDGNYAFFPLPRGESYTVTPSMDGTLYTFTPASRSFSNLQSDQTADFTALPPVMIRGRVTNQYGDGLPATVTLSGTVNRTTETDYSGFYLFYELPRGGDYTVTPSRPDTFWTFTPASRSVTNAQDFQFFDFTAVPPLHIFGHITDENGNGLSGVAVQLSGTLSATAYTDPGGWYHFPELQRGGTYTVTPAHELYNFTPADRTSDNAAEDQTRPLRRRRQTLPHRRPHHGRERRRLERCDIATGGLAGGHDPDGRRGQLRFRGPARRPELHRAGLARGLVVRPRALRHRRPAR